MRDIEMENWGIGNLMTGAASLLFGDRSHPLWLRRLTLLTFPVSIPLLLALCVAGFFIGIVEAIVRSFISIAIDLWRP